MCLVLGNSICPEGGSRGDQWLGRSHGSILRPCRLLFETSHPVSAFGCGGGLFRCVRESKAFGGEVSDSLIETTNRGEREPNQLSAVNHLAISGLRDNFLPRHSKFCQKGI